MPRCNSHGWRRVRRLCAGRRRPRAVAFPQPNAVRRCAVQVRPSSRSIRACPALVLDGRWLTPPWFGALCACRSAETVARVLPAGVQRRFADCKLFVARRQKDLPQVVVHPQRAPGPFCVWSAGAGACGSNRWIMWLSWVFGPGMRRCQAGPEKSTRSCGMQRLVATERRCRRCSSNGGRRWAACPSSRCSAVAHSFSGHFCSLRGHGRLVVCVCVRRLR